MKKFLLILIIALIACAEIEEKVQKEDELEVIFNKLLDSIDFDDPNIVELQNIFDNIINKIKEIVNKGINKGKEIIDKVKEIINKGKETYIKIKDEISNGIDFLKEKGLWDKLVDAAKTAGKMGAITLCSSYLTPVVCGPLVEIVFQVF